MPSAQGDKTFPSDLPSQTCKPGTHLAGTSLPGNTHTSGSALIPAPRASTAEGQQDSLAVTHQGLVLDLLPDEFVLAQGVPRLARDGIDGALLHLLLDGTVEHEQGLPSTFLHERRTPELTQGEGASPVGLPVPFGTGFLPAQAQSHRLNP